VHIADDHDRKIGRRHNPMLAAGLEARLRGLGRMP
jgi:hypothetical protein